MCVVWFRNPLLVGYYHVFLDIYHHVFKFHKYHVITVVLVYGNHLVIEKLAMHTKSTCIKSKIHLKVDL